MDEPLQNQSFARIISNTAGAIRELAGELPSAAREGPEAVADALMNERRRVYLGLALAASALLLLIFY